MEEEIQLSISNTYTFWLFQDRDIRFQLPVPPEELKVSNKAKNTVFNIDGLGEATFVQTPNLLEYSFSSELPANYYGACSYRNLKKPEDSVEILNSMKASGPVRFIVTGTNINILVTIEDFSYSEKGGDVGTLLYSMTLKEYRNRTPRKIIVTPVVAPRVVLTSPTTLSSPVSTPVVANFVAKIPVVASVVRVDTRPVAKTYTVVSGDSLWKIARAQLGDGARYTEIYNLNKGQIKNQDLIYPGQVLTLP